MKRLGLYLLSFFPILALGAFMKGWVLKILWGWFLTPFFHVSSPSIAYCYGIALIFAVITSRKSLQVTTSTQKENLDLEKIYSSHDPQSRVIANLLTERMDNSVSDSLLFAVSDPLAILAVGWIVHRFFL